MFLVYIQNYKEIKSKHATNLTQKDCPKWNCLLHDIIHRF